MQYVHALLPLCSLLRYPVALRALDGKNRKIFIVFSFSFCFVKHSTVRLHAICTKRSDFCLVYVQNAHKHTLQCTSTYYCIVVNSSIQSFFLFSHFFCLHFPCCCCLFELVLCVCVTNFRHTPHSHTYTNIPYIIIEYTILRLLFWGKEGEIGGMQQLCLYLVHKSNGNAIGPVGNVLCAFASISFSTLLLFTLAWLVVHILLQNFATTAIMIDQHARQEISIKQRNTQ